MCAAKVAGQPLPDRGDWRSKSVGSHLAAAATVTELERTASSSPQLACSSDLFHLL